MSRYIAAFLLAIGLIIIVIILIVHGPSTPVQQPINLNNDGNSDTTVQLSVDSPITAPSTHHDIIVNVGDSQSSLVITQGYDGQIINSKSYPMSPNAYSIFLRTLMINGFTLGNNSPAVADETGHCALGDRYTYEVIDGNGNVLQHYWSTTCNTGNFEGDIVVIQQLFQSQIPDYQTLTDTISL
jgi:hypothetical protein